MTVKDEIQILADRIESWDDIAAELKALGIKGFCGDAEHCPLANYIRDITGAAWVSVGPIGIFASAYDDDSRVRLPANAHDFIEKFDNREYPELIKDHSEVGAYV